MVKIPLWQLALAPCQGALGRPLRPNRPLSPLLLVAISLLFCQKAYSQRTISLDECLQIAHKQSPALFEAKRNYEISQWNAEAQARSLGTQVDLTLAAPIYSDNTTPIYNPVTGLTNLLSTRLTQFGPGITIQQPIDWTGGTLSVSSSLYRQTQFGTSGPAINNYLGLGTIQIDQPIFKTNEMALTEHESDMALVDARAQYATQWASINFSIQSLFYNLYEAEEQLKIQQDEVAASQSNYDLAVNKFKAGLIAEVDKLQLEADLAAARTDLFDKQRIQAAAQRDLEIALGMGFQDSLSARLDTLPEVHVTINRDQAVSFALENREDVLAARQAITLSEDALARTGNQRTIYASLTGSFGASQDAVLLSAVTDNPFINRGLTLSVTIPVFDWGAHSLRMEAAQSAIDLNQTALALKEQQVKQEVLSAIDQIEAASAQVEVAKQSVEVAEEAYTLSRDRFDLGKITSQDLTLDQERVTRARLSALTAEVAEQLALADLTQQTLFDFETGKPVMPADE
ncbi:MAG TPA: TolC family protein [Candidatus Kapabacteria bacterium]|nr:TolC family protein [Candidatus Kapabacteria bacterium]